MSLYNVQYDGESYYVESPSFQGAISEWQRHCKDEDILVDNDIEPESVHLISDEPVIRSDIAEKAEKDA